MPNINELSPEFQTAFAAFLKGAQQKMDDYWAAMKYTHAQSPVLEVTCGKRFVAVFKQDRGADGKTTLPDGRPHSRSIHAFIDITGGHVLKAATKPGDILKPASYSAPAKHARGSIFAADFGMSCMSHHGPNSLK